MLYSYPDVAHSRARFELIIMLLAYVVFPLKIFGAVLYSRLPRLPKSFFIVDDY